MNILKPNQRVLIFELYIGRYFKKAISHVTILKTHEADIHNIEKYEVLHAPEIAFPDGQGSIHTADPDSAV